jgi:hypothetical protein
VLGIFELLLAILAVVLVLLANNWLEETQGVEGQAHHIPKLPRRRHKKSKKRKRGR